MEKKMIWCSPHYFILSRSKHITSNPTSSAESFIFDREKNPTSRTMHPSPSVILTKEESRTPNHAPIIHALSITSPSYFRIPTDISRFFFTTFTELKNTSMKPRLIRLCIYTKDIQRITGKSERYSRDLLLKIKIHLDKRDHQLVTVEEFCTYMGLPFESVQPFICD